MQMMLENRNLSKGHICMATIKICHNAAAWVEDIANAMQGNMANVKEHRTKRFNIMCYYLQE